MKSKIYKPLPSIYPIFPTVSIYNSCLPLHSFLSFPPHLYGLNEPRQTIYRTRQKDTGQNTSKCPACTFYLKFIYYAFYRVLASPIGVLQKQHHGQHKHQCHTCNHRNCSTFHNLHRFILRCTCNNHDYCRYR